ncbi:hypothetical protein JTE90_002092 [Oedothorax gibbosus]|uniref:BACK domain-containing protein n=1 Tax=Oedothorax gibbosus TaxID=931172 RepID=A0AAV6UFF5_9ARAC|nr:hypothetical protein JTE90_002092 [Oedothorax gibbosus]
MKEGYLPVTRLKMLSRFFSGYRNKNSTRKKDKEISLLAPNIGDDGEPPIAIKVSRELLLEHSATFREMPRAELKKLGSRIPLKDVTPLALRKIVEYMQKSSTTFLNHTETLETLTASHKYRIDGISKTCVDLLIATLDPSNVCDIYETSLLIQYDILQYHCLKLIDREAEAVLRTRGFSTLKKPTVLSIIKRNSLKVDSETSIFHAVLGWGLNACLRQGGDPNNTEKFLPLVRYLFNYVRFAAMSEEELQETEVQKYHQILTLPLLENHILFGRERAISESRLERSASTTSSIVSVTDQQPRKFIDTYTHSIDLTESDNHQQVKSGESFSLVIEVLKGKIFLSGLRLAFRPFTTTKKACCLYASVLVTNESTKEQRSARGTFSEVSSSDEEVSLDLIDPLPAKETDRVTVSLSVKRAENISVFVIKQDIQIAMPETKAVALKITPVQHVSESDGVDRCILNGFEYFF